MAHTIEIPDDEERLQRSKERVEPIFSMLMREMERGGPRVRLIAKTLAHHGREIMKCRAVVEEEMAKRGVFKK